MVITRLYGGLGNQMFQYAAGLAVSRRLGTALYVDTLWFEPRVHPPDAPPIRRYGLDVFGISPGVPPLLRVALRLGLRRPAVIREEAARAGAELDGVEGDVILDGYWQSAAYFEHAEHDVRDALRFPAPRSAAARRLLDEIARGASVSLHVRRGDYVTNPKHRRLFGVLDPDYYAAATSEIHRRRGAGLDLYVFSDDVTWCRENLELRDAARVTFVTDTAGDAEDLMLMAACRDHVIANSSFSWWGAWLGTAADGIVVAPARWANDPALERPDRIPPGWIRLEIQEGRQPPVAPR
ncbi:MAG TPA: alpha-1,2-fucosyltransferase [Gaiellaceae bacterium]|nr:alpha-1,2-fucosyltransferase [Gaiellaceae bacterium]